MATMLTTWWFGWITSTCKILQHGDSWQRMCLAITCLAAVCCSLPNSVAPKLVCMSVSHCGCFYSTGGVLHFTDKLQHVGECSSDNMFDIFHLGHSRHSVIPHPSTHTHAHTQTLLSKSINKMRPN